MSEQIKALFKKIMIWVGSITAIMSLIFGVQQLTSQFTTASKGKREVAEFIHSSKVLFESNNYPKAWEVLSQADQYDVMEEEVDATKLEIALVWLRNMHANDIAGSFSDQIAQVLPFLSKATSSAEGKRLADIYAHLGYADFLRFRDGNFGLNPEIYYFKALEVEEDNVYANTMLGHWYYWQNKDPDKGDIHFQVAVQSKDNLQYIRNIQFSSLRNADYNNIDFLKLLNEMIDNNEPIDEDTAIRVLKSHYLGLGFDRFFDFLKTGESLESSVSPEGDLKLFHWLENEHPKFVQKYNKQQPYIEAILTEVSGDKARANQLYVELTPGLPENNPSRYKIDDYMQNAIKRTSAND